MRDLAEALARARGGGPSRHHTKASEQGKLPVRERVARLTDEGSFVEDGVLANSEQEGFGADGVVTGMASIAGRPAALMANDPTVKAGSWGPKTVEKIIRIQEQALEHRVPMVYLVDSAGARITEQVHMFPGRRHAGRIFHTEVKLSGVVPQVCVLFGPSAAGGAYIPAFCDVVIMREGNASMCLGSPRMAETVIGEKVSLEEMGGAKMHTGVSGCVHFLAQRRGGHRPRQALPLLLPAPLGRGAARGAARGSRLGRPDPRPDPRRREQAFRRARPARVARRRRVLARGPQALGQGARRGLRAPRRPRGWNRGQPAQAEGRGALRRLRRQGGALHLDVQRVQRAAAVPGRRPRLHDRRRGRAPGHHPGGGEDDLGGLRGHGAEAVGDRAQSLRRRALRDGRPGVRPRRLHRPSGREDRGDGPAGGDQCGVLQPGSGDRGRGRPRGLRREAAARDNEEIDVLRLASELVMDAVVQPEDLRSELVRRFSLYAGRAREWPAKHNAVTPV